MWRFESVHGFASVGNLYQKMHFAGSNLSTDPKWLKIFAFSHPNHAKGVYIINSVGIAYHQCEALYIIKPQEDARYRVMIYKGGIAALDDIPPCGGWYAKPAAWIKKSENKVLGFFGWDRWIRTIEMPESKSGALPLGYIPIFTTGELYHKINTVSIAFGFFKTSLFLYVDFFICLW